MTRSNPTLHAYIFLRLALYHTTIPPRNPVAVGVRETHVYREDAVGYPHLVVRTRFLLQWGVSCL